MRNLLHHKGRVQEDRRLLNPLTAMTPQGRSCSGAFDHITRWCNLLSVVVLFSDGLVYFLSSSLPVAVDPPASPAVLALSLNVRHRTRGERLQIKPSDATSEEECVHRLADKPRGSCWIRWINSSYQTSKTHPEPRRAFGFRPAQMLFAETFKAVKKEAQFSRLSLTFSTYTVSEVCVSVFLCVWVCVCALQVTMTLKAFIFHGKPQQG